MKLTVKEKTVNTHTHKGKTCNGIKLTELSSKEEAILDLSAVEFCFDNFVEFTAGIIEVILVASRSSTFLATANVSTLLGKKRINKIKTGPLLKMFKHTLFCIINVYIPCRCNGIYTLNRQDLEIEVTLIHV